MRMSLVICSDRVVQMDSHGTQSSPHWTFLRQSRWVTSHISTHYLLRLQPSKTDYYSTTTLHMTPTHVFPNHFHHPYSPILPQTFGCSNPPPNSRANEFIIRSALGSFCIHLVQDLNVRRSELGEICAHCYSTNHQSDAPSLCYPP